MRQHTEPRNERRKCKRHTNSQKYRIRNLTQKMFYVEATDGFSVNVDRPQARIFASMVVRSDALNDVCKLITLSTISWPCGLNFELPGRIFIEFSLYDHRQHVDLFCNE